MTTIHRKTIVSHKGIVKFWEMSPEQRKAFMKGGGSKAQRKRNAMTREFIKERDTVLRHLDLARMIKFYHDQGKPLPREWMHPTVPYAMMHKTRLQLVSFTEQEKEISRNWLTAHGYTHELKAEGAPDGHQEQPGQV